MKQLADSKRGGGVRERQGRGEDRVLIAGDHHVCSTGLKSVSSTDFGGGGGGGVSEGQPEDAAKMIQLHSW